MSELRRRLTLIVLLTLPGAALGPLSMARTASAAPRPDAPQPADSPRASDGRTPTNSVTIIGRLRDPRQSFAIHEGRPWLTGSLIIELIEADANTRARLSADRRGRLSARWARPLDEMQPGPRLSELTWRPLMIRLEHSPSDGDRPGSWRVAGVAELESGQPPSGKPAFDQAGYQAFAELTPGPEDGLWSWPPPAFAFLLALLGFGLTYACCPLKNPELAGLKPRLACGLGFAVGGAPMLLLPWLHSGIVTLVGGLPESRLTGLAVVNFVTLGLLFACARYLRIDVAAALITTLVFAAVLLILPVPLAMAWCL